MSTYQFSWTKRYALRVGSVAWSHVSMNSVSNTKCCDYPQPSDVPLQIILWNELSLQLNIKYIGNFQGVSGYNPNREQFYTFYLGYKSLQCGSNKKGRLCDRCSTLLVYTNLASCKLLRHVAGNCMVRCNRCKHDFFCYASLETFFWRA